MRSCNQFAVGMRIAQYRRSDVSIERSSFPESDRESLSTATKTGNGGHHLVLVGNCEGISWSPGVSNRKRENAGLEPLLPPVHAGYQQHASRTPPDKARSLDVCGGGRGCCLNPCPSRSQHGGLLPIRHFAPRVVQPLGRTGRAGPRHMC